MSTLIVRDATLAINGAPETRGEPEEHLEARIREVSGMAVETLEECVDALFAVGGEQEDLEVLLALSIVGMAHPEVLEARGASPVAMGRRAAACRERDGDPEGALALICALRDHNQGHAALDRDYEAIVRRMGMVRDLADRYLERANQLMKVGKEDEAIAWLREVLVLEPNRVEIARRIRNHRLKSEGRISKVPVPRGLLLGAILVPLILAALVLGDRRVRSAHDALPPRREGDLAAMEARLGALDAFIRAHPVWSGALAATKERAALRIAVTELREQEQERREREARARQESLEKAESLRFRGRSRADEGKLAEAADFFREALLIAPHDWEARERLERDIRAIEEYMGTTDTEDER
ncbi:MAG TPA: hypothetical protein ENJ09_07750 [Planctomycetes bacterium]|nr:hypothetical protein [Planctomycetota bacterium]